MKIGRDINLNENEKKVLIAIIENAEDVSGGRFAITTEVYPLLPGFTKNQIKGYLSQLEQKDIIETYPEFNQICPGGLDLEFWEFEI